MKRIAKEKGGENRDMPLVEWLIFHFDAANTLAEIFKDDFKTIKKRLIDVNKNKLKKVNSAQAERLTKCIVKNFHQTISKTVENLTKLKLEMGNELKERCPHLEEDWFNDNCTTVSSSILNYSEISKSLGEGSTGSSCESGAGVEDTEAEIGTVKNDVDNTEKSFVKPVTHIDLGSSDSDSAGSETTVFLRKNAGKRKGNSTKKSLTKKESAKEKSTKKDKNEDKVLTDVEEVASVEDLAVSDNEDLDHHSEEEVETTLESEGNDDTVEAEENDDSVEAEGNDDSVEVEGNDDSVEAEGNDDSVESVENDETVETEGNDETAESEGNDETVESEGNDETVESEGNDEVLGSEDECPIQALLNCSTDLFEGNDGEDESSKNIDSNEIQDEDSTVLGLEADNEDNDHEAMDEDIVELHSPAQTVFIDRCSSNKARPKSVKAREEKAREAINEKKHRNNRSKKGESSDAEEEKSKSDKENVDDKNEGKTANDDFESSVPCDIGDDDDDDDEQTQAVTKIASSGGSVGDENVEDDLLSIQGDDEAGAESDSPVDIKPNVDSSEDSGDLKGKKGVQKKNEVEIIDDEVPGTSRSAIAESNKRNRNTAISTTRNKEKKHDSEVKKSEKSSRRDKEKKLAKEDLDAKRRVLDDSDADDSDGSAITAAMEKKLISVKEKKDNMKTKKKSKIDPNYWQCHDWKKDPKLLKSARVKIEKINEVMVEELLKNPIRLGTMSSDNSSSDEDKILKKITKVMRGLDSYNPILDSKTDRTGKKVKKNKDKKSKKEKKFRLDSSDEDAGSKRERSSDDDDVPLINRSSLAMSIGDSSGEEDLIAMNTSDLDEDKAKAKVLGESGKEKSKKSDSKIDKQNSGSDNSDTDKKKGESYYTPKVCKLKLSSNSDEGKNTGSDSDVVSKKKKRKSSKSEKRITRQQDNDSDSEDDFVPIKTRLRKKQITKKRINSDSSNKSGSDDKSSKSGSNSNASSDSDFVAKKKSTRSTKRGRNSSSEEEKKRKKRTKRLRIKNSDDSDSSKKKSGSDDSDIQEIKPDKNAKDSPQKGRRKIRKLLSKEELKRSTRDAEKDEEERKKRVAEKQKLFNSVLVAAADAPQSCEVLESLVLDLDRETKEPTVSVDTSVVSKLKPHQVEGIKFMYNTTIESADLIKKGNQGGGCILAHCMGLGKTLQTIAFVHTALTHDIGLKTAMVVCPLSTVGNWYTEFRQWLGDADKRVNVHKLWEGKTNAARLDALKYFMRRGGVGIIHYDLFRRLANIDGVKKIKQTMKDQIKSNLIDPGPDIVICDEGHILKNDKSKLSIALSKIRTKRRIVLTGTPLQNNLAEYHTMMSFVKPSLLGTMKEFQNRFINPIKNGQHADSDDHDVRIMKKRAHVLHKLLDGCVQRLDYSVLMPYLPPKHEYVLLIKLSPKQIEMYKYYLDHLMARTTQLQRHGQLLKHYSALVKIWTHPIVLSLKKDKQHSESDSENSLADFIDDDTTSVSASGSEVEWLDSKKNKSKKKKKGGEDEESEDEVKVITPDLPAAEEPEQKLPSDWYSKFFATKEEMYDTELSGKLMILKEILKICESIGDKVLVFSQFITSLNIMEDFLADWDEEGKKKDTNITFPPSFIDSTGRWRKNIEYFRIDGGTHTDDRQKQCDKFNQKHATRAKLFLISTRAGGLGINLFGANRVVIFDASWNPSHDMQSIFRVYRFGQQKPCYIYRLLATGTMEEKIYNRQVVKLSLSCRVVDEQQIERHFKFDDTNEMYRFDPDEKIERPIPPVPKDRLLADLLISQKNWIEHYLEHDSLLENKEDEELTEEERKIAWEEYRQENDNRNRQPANFSGDASTIAKIKMKLLDRFPTANVLQLESWAYQVNKKIQELKEQLNYFNMHSLSMSPEEITMRKTNMNEIQAWIASVLAPVTPRLPVPNLTPIVYEGPNPASRPRGYIRPQFQPHPQTNANGLPQISLAPMTSILENNSNSEDPLLRQSLIQQRIGNAVNLVSGTQGPRPGTSRIAHRGNPAWTQVVPFNPSTTTDSSVSGPTRFREEASNHEN